MSCFPFISGGWSTINTLINTKFIAFMFGWKICCFSNIHVYLWSQTVIFPITTCTQHFSDFTYAPEGHQPFGAKKNIKTKT